MADPSVPDDTTLVGKTLNQYTILEEIGRGGMAAVYRARQESLQRYVAIKVLPPYYLHDAGFYERFEREVDVISQLEHPHILPIYDYGHVRGLPYIVMRYLGGGNMRQVARRGVKSAAMLAKPLNQIAQALDYAHQRQVIHRDLKPDNIMLDEAGNTYLSDFGIARVMGSNLTGTDLLGTPADMSPELIGGLPVGAYSDIYALGIMLFEFLTGKHPFQPAPVGKLLVRHLQMPLPPLGKYRDDLPDEMDVVLAKAAAKDYGDRYASAGELAQAFSQVLNIQPAPAFHPKSSLITKELKKATDAKATGLFDSATTLRIEIIGYSEPVVLRFDRKASYVLGRIDDKSDAVDVNLNPYGGYENGVSRRHAVIALDSTTKDLTVCDLHSSNGTYLNHSRLTPGDYYRVRDGDELRLARLAMSISFQKP